MSIGRPGRYTDWDVYIVAEAAEAQRAARRVNEARFADGMAGGEA